MALTADFILTLVFILHITHPISSIYTYGLPFLFILPGLTVITPIWGLVGTISG